MLAAKVMSKFAKAASTYDQHAYLQQEVASRLMERLSYCQFAPDTILDIGCATGKMLALLEQQYPGAKTYGIDYSLAMIQKAKEASTKHGLACANGALLPFANNSMDLICLNLVLHWNIDYQAMLLECQRVLDVEGLIIFSTVGQGSLSEMQLAWQQVDTYQHIHDFVAMIDLGNLMLKQGWQDPVLDKEVIQIAFPSVSALLADFKGLGITNSSDKAMPGLMTPRKLAKFKDNYPATDGKFMLSYNIVYGHGIKKS